MLMFLWRDTEMASRKCENAISPVVGVMLMLVVTVVIAAVVSAFAGGLADDQEKTPQATMRAEYSQSRGMTIEHLGGDVLKTKSIGIILKPSGNYGAGMEEWTTVIDKSLISDCEGKMWFDDKGAIDVPGFGPGDTAYISAENCTTEYLEPEIWDYAVQMAGYSGADPHDMTDWGISNSDFVGGTFYLEFFDSSGKMITKIEVPIMP
jgi:flagellin-like protein